MTFWLILGVLLYFTVTALFILGCCRAAGQQGEQMGLQDEGTLLALPTTGQTTS